MTVAAQTPVNSSDGNGVTTVFPYSFKILRALDLEVRVDDVPLSLGVHYTVSGAGNNGGGNVTMLTPPAVNAKVVRRRNMSFVRETDFQYQGNLPAAVLNPDLDRPVLMIQQVAEMVDRSLTGAPGASWPSLPPSLALLDRVLVFDATTGFPIPSPYTSTQVASAIAAAYSAGASTADAVMYVQSGANVATRSVQARLRDRLYVRDFAGVDPTGVTDSTAGVRAAVVELHQRGGGILDFSGTTLKLATTGGLGSLFQFLNLNGVLILGYGCKLIVDTTRVPTNSEGTIFLLDGCSNVTIDGFETDGPVVDITQTTVKGYEFVRCINGCRNINMPSNKVKNLLAGFIASKLAADADTKRTRNVHIGNLDVEHCWYGVNLQHSGDNCQIENLRTDTIHRSLFIYGLKNLHANVRAKDSYSWDVNLSSFAGSTLEHIRINYLQGTDTQNAGDSDRVMFIAADAVAGTWRDIHVNVDITYAPTGNTGASAVRFSKLDNGGSFDTTNRGHTYEDIRISGRVKGVPHYPDGGPVSLDNQCSWGENFRNITLDGFSAPDHTQRCWWPQNGFTTAPGLTLRNTRLAGPLYLQPTGVTAPYKVPVRMENSSCSNAWTFDSSVPPVQMFYAAGDTTIPVGYSGKALSNRGASGVKTDTLPTAQPGMEYFCVREAAFEYRIDPDPFDNFRASSAGKYLSMNANGNAVQLKCVVPGVWEIASVYGATTFEP